MANAHYPYGIDQFLNGAIDWVSDDIRIILVDTALYTYNAAHQFLSSVPSGARLATVALASKATNGAGVADAANPTAPSVAAGNTIGAIIVYKHTGVEGSSPLIAFYDTGTNLPVVTNGGDITVAFDDQGVFAL